MRQDDFSNACGNCKIVCCRGAHPPLTPERIRIIDSHQPQLQSSWYCREEYAYPRETSRGCVFLDDGKMCTIQPYKPETCVAGPITFDINVGKSVIDWYLKTEKICKLAGILSRDDEMLRKHLKSAKREINNLIRRLSKEELLTILTIDEPDTFKIDEDKLDSETLKKLR